jgi:hypothetical protein
MHNNDYSVEQHYCRVCGLYQDETPWGEDGKTPTFNICDCCGTEFGYHDATPSAIKQSRKKWIEGGSKWFDLSCEPQDWNLNQQLQNIDK